MGRTWELAVSCGSCEKSDGEEAYDSCKRNVMLGLFTVLTRRPGGRFLADEAVFFLKNMKLLSTG